MSEIKNLFIATVLSVIVLVGWQNFYESKNVNKDTTEVVDNQEVEKETKTSKSLENLDQSSISVKDQIDVKQEVESQNISQKDLLIRIDNDFVDGSISRRGLIFNNLSLKKYRETLDPGSPEVTLLDKKNQYYAEIGFSQNDDKTIDLPTKNTVWDVDGMVLTPEKPLNFTWKNKQGMFFNVKVSLDKEYLFKIEKSIVNNFGKEIDISSYSRLYKALDSNQGGGIAHEGVIGFFNKELIKFSYEKVMKKEDIIIRSKDKNNKLSWVGFGDKYWMSALIGNENGSSIVAKGLVKNGDKIAQIENLYSATLDQGEEFKRTEYIFLGAKELNTLDKYEKQYGITMFDHAVDFGSLYFITKPIFLFLQYLHKVICNFGIAIMILTLVIKIILFPLTKKSLVSMHRMRELQPQMEEIKNKFKDDKTRMNMELVSLFKTNKVSPFSSIMPMLIQIPIFFALYKVLYITIEMRHAQFFFWIKDLSARDSLNVFSVFDSFGIGISQYLNLGVLSIILGLTMILQQKLQPKPAIESSHMTALKWMPYIFTIISASFPAGLVIYWSWNNILSMIQQVIVDHFVIKNKKNIVEKIR
jgi:YidC/Oxa1 family membrane protein insertase